MTDAYVCHPSPVRSSTCHFGAARGALSRLSNLSERPEQGVRDGRPTNARAAASAKRALSQPVWQAAPPRLRPTPPMLAMCRVAPA